eukprot:6685771-Pyramimonas_sp.AAC.1
MAGEVDPADAALAGCASGDCIAAGVVACKTDTPIDPERAVTADVDLFLGRQIACRAEGAGWIRTSMERRLSSTKYLLAGEQTTIINNMALRTPSGINVDPGRDPARHGPWAQAGATANAAPKPKPETPIDISSSSDSSSSSLSPDQLRPKQNKRNGPDDPNPGD